MEHHFVTDYNDSRCTNTFLIWPEDWHGRAESYKTTIIFSSELLASDASDSPDHHAQFGISVSTLEPR